MKKTLFVLLVLAQSAISFGSEYTVDFNNVDLRLEQMQSTADNHTNPFPFANHCSCNLTDYCEVSCSQWESAMCVPYKSGPGYYCSCWCE